MNWIGHIGIFVFACLLEAGWVAAVRFVSGSKTVSLITMTGFMQILSYVSTRVVVEDESTIISGAIGAMLGAWIGMRLKPTESQSIGPTRKIGFRNSGPSSGGG